MVTYTIQYIIYELIRQPLLTHVTSNDIII